MCRHFPPVIFLRPSFNWRYFLDATAHSRLLPHTHHNYCSNSKNRLWNSSTTDKMGKELEMILSDYRINLVNAPLHKLDFIPGGTSFVDQTLAGEKVTVSRCFFLSIPSLSDHPYIYFEVLPNTQSPASGPNNTSKSIPHISSINQSLLNDKIAASLRQSVFQNFPSKEQVQVQIANLTKVIADSTRSA